MPTLSKGREEALEKLAYELAWKENSLDPEPDGEWEMLSERDREFYRLCINWLMTHEAEILIALGYTSPTTTSKQGVLKLLKS